MCGSVSKKAKSWSEEVTDSLGGKSTDLFSLMICEAKLMESNGDGVKAHMYQAMSNCLMD